MFTPSSHLVYRVEDGDSGDSGDNPRITWPAAWRQRWRLSPGSPIFHRRYLRLQTESLRDVALPFPYRHAAQKGDRHVLL
ncbi:hypothetical protein B4O85_20975 [Pseudomonas azotoformans]|uniref:Uncharacterized protein n=1 Tax=Pseudomonas azotoformans TaxID=47878 RepID=A0A4Q0HR52_PSEAZ|nr:hypothetical protein B4O85_20975 [Pseudomonas azotoformans]